MSESGQWYQQRGSRSVTGRFVVIQTVHGLRSREAGHTVWVDSVGLETKIAGSRDISVQLVKPHNVAELAALYPEAYEAFGRDQMDAIWSDATGPAAPAEIEVLPADDATPLTDLKGVGRERAAAWNDRGILSVEMLADLADARTDDLGLHEWRLKARRHLGREG